jgi:hypothetical protein
MSCHSNWQFFVQTGVELLRMYAPGIPPYACRYCTLYIRIHMYSLIALRCMVVRIHVIIQIRSTHGSELAHFVLYEMRIHTSCSALVYCMLCTSALPLTSTVRIVNAPV